MTLKPVLDMDNDAFCPHPGPEAGRILRALADKIGDGDLSPGDQWPLKDENGNTCGMAKVES